MAMLARAVAGLTEVVPLAAPVYYLDYPVHTNVGDLLIEWGTESFLAGHGYDIAGCRSAYDFDDRAIVQDGATILLHGGGNFGDLYDLHQDFRERVIDRFPDHKIVMLPQTMFFRSSERLQACARVFNRHRDLTVCLRDELSLSMFRQHFGNTGLLVPDMAHYLSDELSFLRARAPTARCLAFARTDMEAGEFERGADCDGPVDWRDLVGAGDERRYRLLYHLHRCNRLVGNRLKLHGPWRRFCDRLIARATGLVGRYGHLRTNRLHMALLGLLAGRQVEMQDNSYGKLSAYYDTWLKDIPGATLIR